MYAHPRDILLAVICCVCCHDSGGSGVVVYE